MDQVDQVDHVDQVDQVNQVTDFILHLFCKPVFCGLFPTLKCHSRTLETTIFPGHDFL
jgi:hypothetical protein